MLQILFTHPALCGKNGQQVCPAWRQLPDLIQIFYQNFEGCAFGETNPIRFLESEAFSCQQSVDNSDYYNPYPSAAGYDYSEGYLV